MHSLALQLGLVTSMLPSHNLIFIRMSICCYIQTSMSASATMEVANRTAMTQMEVTHAPAMMTTSLTVMDIHVKVPAR